MELHLDRLPRTVAVEVSQGIPSFVMVDQRALPEKLVYVKTSDWRSVIDAVKTLLVRGAPAIGVAGAAVVMLRAFEFVAADAESPAEMARTNTTCEDSFACLMCQRRKPTDTPVEKQGVIDGQENTPTAGEEVLCAALDTHRTFVLDERAFDPDLFLMALEFAGDMAKAARPTAVNLAWGVDCALTVARTLLKVGAQARAVSQALLEEVQRLILEDEQVNRTIGTLGKDILRSQLLQSKTEAHTVSKTESKSKSKTGAEKEGLNVLTHCNAGSLATAFYGTALGVIYAAAEENLINHVYADETRPVGQGARLTSWELAQVGIPVTLLCDNMAATLMQQGTIDAVIVGADRIAANGDVANKIGTYNVALLAHYFDIPFYVAAPLSTIDETTPNGEHIPIEQRDASEVLPSPIEGVDVYNPAFDITPYSLVTAIITEAGVWKPAQACLS